MMNETDFNACINILAVEFLIKENNEKLYGEYCTKVYEIYNCKDDEKNAEIDILMELNVHSRNLGEMITQNDYDELKEGLIKILDNYKN